MKKILITGANSYIGTSFETYVKEKFFREYLVDTIDVTDDSWKKQSFAGYDTVLHVAGIAHRKETKENAHLYYEVNRDLSYDVAQKACADGAKQFIYISSMSIYGKSTGVITKSTPPNPKSHYGKSKLEGELLIKTLHSEAFKVCILRPPMVYGEGCKGNYNTLIKIVKRFPVFPKVKNQRSAIHIDHLTAFMVSAIRKELNGCFVPQDNEYINTTQMAKDIADDLNKRIYASYCLGAVVCLLRPFSKTLTKAFGSLIYEMGDF